MYLKKETEFQYAPGIELVLEDVQGGGTIARADIKAVIDELPPLAIVGKDSNGLYHVVKTAKIVAGGTNAAPRIAKNHVLVVGDIISDGVVSLEISAITVGTDYDTLTFDAGVLSVYAATTVLYITSTVDTVGGVPATAVVEDGAADTLTVTIPVASTPANFNGLSVVLSQAADDNLAVSYEDGILSIALANTTAAKNNAATIQVAIRALGLVGVGLDFSAATAVGAAGWDGAQTGATLTVASDVFEDGVNYGVKAYKYTPEAITMTKVDTTVANQSSGLLVRGTVNESVLPYPIDAAIKAVLNLIRFV